MELASTRPDGTRILRIRTRAGSDLFRAAFVGAYQSVWSEPPYNERFFPDEAEGVLRKAVSTPDNITLLAVREPGIVAGFAIAYPLHARVDIVREVRGLLPIEETIYFAELGVVEDHRGNGLGRELIRLRLEAIDTQRYHHVLMRTSAARTGTYELYAKAGFVDTGVYMEVPSRRVDNTVQTDRRLFMAKVL